MRINLRVLSVTVMVLSGMIGAVQVAGPDSLGISAVAIRWLGIVAAGLAIVQGVLPRVQGPSDDPKVIADRIMDLDHGKRLEVLAELEARRAPAIDPTTTAGRAALDDERPADARTREV